MSAGALAVGGIAASSVAGFFGRRARAKALARDAKMQQMAGEAEAADRLREGDAAIASASVRAAAGGFTSEGSATDVLAMLARRVDVDSRRARYDASLRAQRLRNEARQERTASYFGLAGGLTDAAARALAPTGTPAAAAGSA